MVRSNIILPLSLCEMTFVKDTTELPDSGILHTVNTRFHAAYQQRKRAYHEAFVGGDYQVVLRLDDRIILVNGDTQQTFTVVGDEYHHIKAAAHFPLLLMYTTDHTERLALLDSFRQSNESPFLDQWTNAITHWMEQCKGGELMCVPSLKEALLPLFAEAMDKVAQQEVEKTVEVLDNIRDTSRLPLDKTFFVIFGSRQARYKQLGKMIIKRWFRHQLACFGNVEHHVRYCEGGSSIKDAYELLSTALADSELSHTFLGDQYALNQDVVTQTAERHISQFWPDG